MERMMEGDGEGERQVRSQTVQLQSEKVMLRGEAEKSKGEKRV